MPTQNSFVINNISSLVTCEPHLSDSEDEGGRAIGLVDNGAIVVREGRIAWVGRQSDLPRDEIRDLRVVDAKGFVCLPGLIDCHTHMVFVGTREKEYELRLRGVPYMEIARQGGGILSTVSRVRSASVEELVEATIPRLRDAIACGTTTVEIKSGYGLDLKNEIKMLEAIRVLSRRSEIEIVPTFLGAHEVPPEYKGRKRQYIEVIKNEMIPEITRRRLAEFCDVFCERGVFDPDESEEILVTAQEHGLKPKIHADELEESGGAEVAAKVGAVSAEHLVCASTRGLKSMQEAGTVAVLLPGVSVGLGKLSFANARAMIDLGLDVAIATDMNPGTSMVSSLTVVSTLACSFMKMMPDEVIRAMTINAAKALSRAERLGSLKPGKDADLVLFDIPDFRYIPYHFGGNFVRMVFKKGRLIWKYT